MKSSVKSFALLFALLVMAIAGAAAITPNIYHVVKEVTVAPTTDADGSGGYFAAQMDVREIMAKGQHVTLRLSAQSEVYASPTFWYDFLGESGDLWELQRAERLQRIYAVINHVHLKSGDMAYSARVHRALEKGAAMWMNHREFEPLASEDRD